MHPYYVSIFQLNKAPESNRAQVLIKVYTNDLEEAIEKTYNKKLYLNSTNESKFITDSLLHKYTLKEVALLIKAKPTELIWVGYEYEADVTWLYLETKKEIKADFVEFQTTFLTSIYPEQKNMIHLNWNDRKESYLLDKQTTIAKIGLW